MPFRSCFAIFPDFARALDPPQNNLDDIQSIHYNVATQDGRVAQLGERYNRTVQVMGSSPFASTEFLMSQQMLLARLFYRSK